MLLAALALPRAMPSAAAQDLSIREAEQSFVLRHHGFVTRALWSRACPRGALDDAVQQVFLVALKQRAEMRDERAFLFGVATRVAREMSRAAQRHAPPIDEPSDTQPSSDPHPEALLERKRARALLDEALDSLPDDVRVVFVLYEIEELTLKEISDLTELPQGTVASRLRRGRELFRESAKRMRARIEHPRGGS